MLYIVLTIQTILELLIIIIFTIFVVAVMVFVGDRLEICYENWKERKRMRRLEKESEEWLQRLHEMRLHKKEMKRYPLFYWRELIEEKLEDGNF